MRCQCFTSRCWREHKRGGTGSFSAVLNLCVSSREKTTRHFCEVCRVYMQFYEVIACGGAWSRLRECFLGAHHADGWCSVSLWMSFWPSEQQRVCGSEGPETHQQLSEAVNKFLNKYYDAKIYPENNWRSVQGLYSRSNVIFVLLCS